jgi:hypothetical protein
MRSRSLPHRWMAWIALWAILLAALAPTVSRYLAATAPRLAAVQMEICVTRPGSPSVVLSTSRSEQPADHQVMDHCPLCLMHTDQPGLPPASTTLALASGLSHVVPSLFLHAPAPLHAWATAHARAPPVSQA